MSEVVRTGVSLESDLLEKFDEAIAAKGYGNRSEAIRDLIREHLVAQEIDNNKMVVGTLTIVYDHHRPNLTEKLVDLQHHAGGSVLAATHVHMDHHNCLEVIIMKGRGGELKSLGQWHPEPSRRKARSTCHHQHRERPQVIIWPVSFEKSRPRWRLWLF